MRIARFRAAGKTRYGIVTGESVQELPSTPFRSLRPTTHSYSFDGVRLMAPCTPSKIVALGLNYRSHADEFKSKLPEVPLIFLKPSTAVIGPEENIVYPPSSTRVDYEGELAVVIKKRASRVPVEQAMGYVLGYTCLNDVTARDLQSRDKQWTRAKSFDTFAPVGPWIETDLDPAGLTIETLVNGQLRQTGNTRDLIFTVPHLVSFISQVMTLLPGDVIATGTPAGVGPISPGDTVEVRIESIGTLRNYVFKNGGLE